MRTPLTTAADNDGTIAERAAGIKVDVPRPSIPYRSTRAPLPRARAFTCSSRAMVMSPG